MGACCQIQLNTSSQQIVTAPKQCMPIATKALCETRPANKFFPDTTCAQIDCLVPDLKVTATAQNPTGAANIQISPGQQVSFAVKVENIGAAPADNVALTITLPPSMVAVGGSFVASGGPTCTMSNGNTVVNCKRSTLPVGGSFTITGKLTMLPTVSPVPSCLALLPLYASATTTDSEVSTDNNDAKQDYMMNCGVCCPDPNDSNFHTCGAADYMTESECKSNPFIGNPTWKPAPNTCANCPASTQKFCCNGSTFKCEKKPMVNGQCPEGSKEGTQSGFSDQTTCETSCQPPKEVCCIYNRTPDQNGIPVAVDCKLTPIPATPSTATNGKRYCYFATNTIGEVRDDLKDRQSECTTANAASLCGVEKVDLALTKKFVSASPSIKEGATVTFEIEVTNLSQTTAAQHVTVQDNYNPNLLFISADGASCKQAANPDPAKPSTAHIYCDLDYISAKSSKKFTINFTILPKGTFTQCTITNRANVFTTSIDSNASNNFGSADVNNAYCGGKKYCCATSKVTCDAVTSDSGSCPNPKANTNPDGYGSQSECDTICKKPPEPVKHSCCLLFVNPEENLRDTICNTVASQKVCDDKMSKEFGVETDDKPAKKLTRKPTKVIFREKVECGIFNDCPKYVQRVVCCLSTGCERLMKYVCDERNGSVDENANSCDSKNACKTPPKQKYCCNGSTYKCSQVPVDTDGNCPAGSQVGSKTGYDESSKCDAICIAPKADITVKKVMKPTNPPDAKRKAGDTVEYTITIYNKGEEDATDVTLTDFIPYGLSIHPEGGMPSQGHPVVPAGCSDSVPSLVKCSGITVPKQSSVDITLKFKINDPPSICTRSYSVGTNKAYVQALTKNDDGTPKFDKDPNNNVAEAYGFEIDCPSWDVKKEIVPTAGPYQLGQEVTFTITMTRKGNDYLGPTGTWTQADSMVDVIPDDFTLKSVPSDCLQSGQKITCTIPPGIKKGQKHTVTLVAVVNPGACNKQSFENNAEVMRGNAQLPGASGKVIGDYSCRTPYKYCCSKADTEKGTASQCIVKTEGADCDPARGEYGGTPVNCGDKCAPAATYCCTPPTDPKKPETSQCMKRGSASVTCFIGSPSYESSSCGGACSPPPKKTYCCSSNSCVDSSTVSSCDKDMVPTEDPTCKGKDGKELCKPPEKKVWCCSTSNSCTEKDIGNGSCPDSKPGMENGFADDATCKPACQPGNWKIEVSLNASSVVRIGNVISHRVKITRIDGDYDDAVHPKMQFAFNGVHHQFYTTPDGLSGCQIRDVQFLPKSLVVCDLPSKVSKDQSITVDVYSSVTGDACIGSKEILAFAKVILASTSSEHVTASVKSPATCDTGEKVWCCEKSGPGLQNNTCAERKKLDGCLIPADGTEKSGYKDKPTCEGVDPCKPKTPEPPKTVFCCERTSATTNGCVKRTTPERCLVPASGTDPAGYKDEPTCKATTACAPSTATGVCCFVDKNSLITGVESDQGDCNQTRFPGPRYSNVRFVPNETLEACTIEQPVATCAPGCHEAVNGTCMLFTQKTTRSWFASLLASLGLIAADDEVPSDNNPFFDSDGDGNPANDIDCCCKPTGGGASSQASSSQKSLPPTIPTPACSQCGTAPYNTLTTCADPCKWQSTFFFWGGSCKPNPAKCDKPTAASSSASPVAVSSSSRPIAQVPSSVSSPASSSESVSSASIPDVFVVFGQLELCGNGRKEGSEQCDDGRKNVATRVNDEAVSHCSVVCRKPACDDALDNDGDTFVDRADPGCYKPPSGTIVQRWTNALLAQINPTGIAGDFLPGRNNESCNAGMMQTAHGCIALQCPLAQGNRLALLRTCGSQCGADQRCIASCTCHCDGNLGAQVGKQFDSCMAGNEPSCADGVRMPGQSLGICCKLWSIGSTCRAKN